MEVDVLPLAVPALPDARLLRLAGARPALVVHVLGQADVSDAGGVLADQVDVGVQDGGVDGLAVLCQNWERKNRERGMNVREMSRCVYDKTGFTRAARSKFLKIETKKSVVLRFSK